MNCVVIRNGKVVSPAMDLVELALIVSQRIDPARVPDICLAAIASFYVPEVEN